MRTCPWGLWQTNSSCFIVLCLNFPLSFQLDTAHCWIVPGEGNYLCNCGGKKKISDKMSTQWKIENTGSQAIAPVKRAAPPDGKPAHQRPAVRVSLTLGKPLFLQGALQWAQPGSGAAWAGSENLSCTVLSRCHFQMCLSIFSPCPLLLKHTSQCWCCSGLGSAQSWLRSYPAKKRKLSFHPGPQAVWLLVWRQERLCVQRSRGWVLGWLTLMAKITSPARNVKLGGIKP